MRTRILFVLGSVLPILVACQNTQDQLFPGSTSTMVQTSNGQIISNGGAVARPQLMQAADGSLISVPCAKEKLQEMNSAGSDEGAQAIMKTCDVKTLKAAGQGRGLYYSYNYYYYPNTNYAYVYQPQSYCQNQNTNAYFFYSLLGYYNFNPMTALGYYGYNSYSYQQYPQYYSSAYGGSCGSCINYGGYSCQNTCYTQSYLY